MKSGLLSCIILVLSALIVALPALAQEESTAETAEVEASAESTLPESGYRLVQPDDILFTFIEFRQYDHLHQLQEQMLSIPGLTNFIPQLEAPGLLTYKLHYSGTTDLLMKALQELFGAQYELGLKEIGEKSWEITLRRSSHSAESSSLPSSF